LLKSSVKAASMKRFYLKEKAYQSQNLDRFKRLDSVRQWRY